MDPRLPLFSLLSQALVAFIVEFDNEFERRVPHQTSDYGGSRGAPFLVSMVIWQKFLRHVPEEGPDAGIDAGDLQKRLLLSTPEMRRILARMSKWWGYVFVAGKNVRLMPGGRKAFEVWRGLTEEIEKRWRDRFEIDQVKRELAKLADQNLPDHLPILGYGLWSRPDALSTPTGTLPGLLSKVLLRFAIEYESQSTVSLAIGANVLRLIGDETVRVRDLPRLSCVSKEGIAIAVSFLTKQGFADLGAQRSLRLDAKGRAARDEYFRLVAGMEKKWNAKELRAVLEPLAIELPEPPPGTWRAQAPRAAGLPHYPMILHRGGYPDGS